MNPRISLLAAFAAIAISQPALAIQIPTVPVGNPGNAGQVQSTGTFGDVAYNYSIGKYEVTVGEYTAFLNAVAAADTYGLYNLSMASDLNIAGIAQSGSFGSYSYSVIGSANKPVTYVNWGDAGRFANWLHNGQPTGAQNLGTTESGAYFLNGAVDEPALVAVLRSAGARWFIPSLDEWYKAAYHKNDGVTGNYWRSPTSSDSTPYTDQPPGGSAPTQSNTVNANFNDGAVNGYNEGYAVTGSTTYSSTQNYLTDVGAYPLSASPYNTFDQGGNVYEWTEALFSHPIGPVRDARGGWWGDHPFYAQAVAQSLFISQAENYGLGFRVATLVPEPSSLILAALGLIGFAA